MSEITPAQRKALMLIADQRRMITRKHIHPRTVMALFERDLITSFFSGGGRKGPYRFFAITDSGRRALQKE